MSTSSSCCAVANCLTTKTTAVVAAEKTVAVVVASNRADTDAEAQLVAAYRWGSCFYWRWLLTLEQYVGYNHTKR